MFCDNARFGRLSPRGSGGRVCSAPEFAENVTGPKLGPVRDLDVMSVVDRGCGDLYSRSVERLQGCCCGSILSSNDLFVTSEDKAQAFARLAGNVDAYFISVIRGQC